MALSLAPSYAKDNALWGALAPTLGRWFAKNNDAISGVPGRLGRWFLGGEPEGPRLNGSTRPLRSLHPGSQNLNIEVEALLACLRKAGAICVDRAPPSNADDGPREGRDVPVDVLFGDALKSVREGGGRKAQTEVGETTPDDAPLTPFDLGCVA